MKILLLFFLIPLFTFLPLLLFAAASTTWMKYGLRAWLPSKQSHALSPADPRAEAAIRTEHYKQQEIKSAKFLMFISILLFTAGPFVIALVHALF